MTFDSLDCGVQIQVFTKASDIAFTAQFKSLCAGSNSSVSSFHVSLLFVQKPPLFLQICWLISPILQLSKNLQTFCNILDGTETVTIQSVASCVVFLGWFVIREHEHRAMLLFSIGTAGSLDV